MNRKPFSNFNQYSKDFISKHSIRKIFLTMMIIFAIAGIGISAGFTYSLKYTIKRVQYTNKTFFIKTELYGDTYLADTFGEKYENVSLIPDMHSIFEIHAYEITPTGYPKGYKFPTIVWSHGMVANDDYQLHYALEFARAGFKVYAINLEGMGSSGGHWDLGVTDQQVIYSTIEYAAKQPDVDLDKIAVSGHSNGGFAAARAGVFDKSPLGTGGLIKSVASIWTVSDFNETMIEMIGDNPLNDPSYGWFIPMFYGGHGMIVTEDDILRRSVTDYVNESSNSISNWYVLSGSADQFASADIMYNAISAASGDFANASEIKNAVESQWGSVDTDSGTKINNRGFWNNSITQEKIDNGTARKIMIEKGMDHLAEAMSPFLVQEMIDWFVLTLNLDPAEHVSRIEAGQPVMFYWIMRFVGISFLLISLFLSQFVVGAYLAPVMFPEQRLKYKKLTREDELEKQRKEDSIKSISPELQEYLVVVDDEDPRKLFLLFFNNWKRKLIFWLGMIICLSAGLGLFFAIMPLPITRFWEFNAFVWQFFFSGIFMWIFAIIVLIYYHRSEEYGPYVNLRRIGASWEGMGKGLAYAIIVAVIPFAVYDIIALLVHAPLFLPRPLGESGLYLEVLLAAAMFWFLYLPMETLTKTQLFAIKRRFKTKGGYWLELLINASLVFFIWFVSYIIGMLFMDPKLMMLVFSGNFGGTIFVGVIFIMFAMNGVAAFLTAFIYQRTRNLFACSYYPVILFSLVVFGKFFGIYSAF